MLWDVFGARVVERVRGPYCGTCSGPMLWDMFGAYVVGRVRGIGPDNDASSFPGLGGTGVNTLIADPKYDLIGEDVHVWHT